MGVSKPTFDANGYPTEATLRRIRRWPIKELKDLEEAMDFAGQAWRDPELWTKERWFDDLDRPGWSPCLRYVFSTGGWSGNEAIVAAIKKNPMLESMGAWSWRRGGHYDYRFPMKEQG